MTTPPGPVLQIQNGGVPAFNQRGLSVLLKQGSVYFGSIPFAMSDETETSLHCLGPRRLFVRPQQSSAVNHSGVKILHVPIARQGLELRGAVVEERVEEGEMYRTQ